MQPCHSGGGDYSGISPWGHLWGSATLECCALDLADAKACKHIIIKENLSNTHKNAASRWSPALMRPGKREDQQRRFKKKKMTVEVISDSLRKIHKMESRDMTSWWSLGNGSPASHNWNNGAGCQKSRRHIMHIRATNVRGSIDRENGRVMTEMEHFIRKPESSLYERSLFRCNTLWWKTSSSSPTQYTWKDGLFLNS